MLRFKVLREDIGFRVEMIKVLVFGFGTLPGITKSRSDEASFTQRCQDIRMCGCISDVLALFVLEIVAELTNADAFLRRPFEVGQIEERFPEIRDREDEIGALEGRDEGRWVMEICLNHLNAFVGQFLGGRRSGIAGEAPDAPLGVVQEYIRDGATLVSCDTYYHDQLCHCFAITELV